VAVTVGPKAAVVDFAVVAAVAAVSSVVIDAKIEVTIVAMIGVVATGTLVAPAIVKMVEAKNPAVEFVDVSVLNQDQAQGHLLVAKKTKARQAALVMTN
jgi:hypothetical protein